MAFVVDRWVLDGGTPAREGPAEQLVVKPTSPPEPRPATTTAATPAPAQRTTGHSLAGRLAAMAEARRFQTAAALADGFRPSDQWLAAAMPPPPAPKIDVKPAKAAAASVAVKVDHAGHFVRTHSLDAVMMNKGGGMAIINGKLYRPGQYVDGFKLTKVGMKDARFWGKGSGATLKLAGQPAVADAR